MSYHQLIGEATWRDNRLCYLCKLCGQLSLQCGHLIREVGMKFIPDFSKGGQ